MAVVTHWGWGLFPWEMGSEKEDPDRQAPPQLTLDPGARGTQGRQRPAQPESLARSTHWRGQHKDTRVSAHLRVAGLGQHGTGRTLRGTGLGLGGRTRDA